MITQIEKKSKPAWKATLSAKTRRGVLSLFCTDSATFEMWRDDEFLGEYYGGHDQQVSEFSDTCKWMNRTEMMSDSEFNYRQAIFEAQCPDMGIALSF